MELPKQGALADALKEPAKSAAQEVHPALKPKPVIDHALWDHPAHPIHHKIHDAVDNHIHNIVAGLMHEHHTTDPYSGIDKLNTELQKRKPKQLKQLDSDLDNLSDIDPHEKPNS